MKHLIKRGFRQLGLDVRRTGYSHDIIDFISDRAIDVVYDVGANVGQFGAGLREKGYRGKIVSFEPIPDEYRNLVSVAAADGNWHTNNFALGAKVEQTTINISEASVFSSILSSTTAGVRHDETAAVVRAETIEVRRLDDIVSDVVGNVLLRIDTQGYERQVLEGSRRVLPAMKGVLMELPIIHLYEQTWMFHEAIAFMADVGFVPAQIHPVNYHSVDRMSLVEVDCLFRPRDARID